MALAMSLTDDLIWLKSRSTSNEREQRSRWNQQGNRRIINKRASHVTTTSRTNRFFFPSYSPALSTPMGGRTLPKDLPSNLITTSQQL